MRRNLLIFLFIVISYMCPAQNDIVVKGLVRGEKSGPIAGAAVSAVGVEIFVKTDSAGMFVMTVPAGVERIQAEAPGYHKLALRINGEFMTFDLKVDEKYVSKAREYAMIEEQLVRDAQRRKVEEEKARIKAEKMARIREIDEQYNKNYKNKGLVHTLELAYGYQLAHGDVVYKNLGYREYGNLHPVELNYTLAYRFNNFVSVGIGTGLQYQIVNLCTYGDVFSPSYDGYEDFTPFNVPLFLNTKLYLTRGKFQPIVSLSGGIYLPNCEGLCDIGIGANLRLNRNANMYFLLSCRPTPYGDFREYSGQEGIASRPAFFMYYTKVAWAPSFKIGFTL